MTGDCMTGMRRRVAAGVAMLLLTATTVIAQRVPVAEPVAAGDRVVADTQRQVDALIDAVVVELDGRHVEVRPFRSRGDYFRTSFSPWRFVTGLPMRYRVLVNPEGARRGWPPVGVEAIVVHELAHIADMARGPRIRLFGYLLLLFRGPSARFERRADLEAIARGHGPGLAAYRRWLYDNVPAERLAEKRRNYFSPEEIEAVLRLSADDPTLLDYWRRHPPLTLAAILAGRRSRS